jgi:hypothetical protein
MTTPRGEVRAGLDRVRELWVEIAATPKRCPEYKRLVEAIRAESLAYRAHVEAATGDKRDRR